MHIHTFLYKLVKNMDSKGVPEVMYPWTDFGYVVYIARFKWREYALLGKKIKERKKRIEQEHF
jgi:hypothetical protein